MTHDISPENLPDNPDDYESEIRKEKYILSCLTKRAPSPEVECTKDNGDEKQELSPLQIKQKTLEQLNNVINNQYHGVIRQGEKQHNSRDQHNIGDQHKIGEQHIVGDSECTVKVDADLISNTQQKKTDLVNTTQEGDTLIIDELQVYFIVHALHTVLFLLLTNLINIKWVLIIIPQGIHNYKIYICLYK